MRCASRKKWRLRLRGWSDALSFVVLFVLTASAAFASTGPRYQHRPGAWTDPRACAISAFVVRNAETMDLVRGQSVPPTKAITSGVTPGGRPPAVATPTSRPRVLRTRSEEVSRRRYDGRRRFPATTAPNVCLY